MRRTALFLALLATSEISRAADKPIYASPPTWIKPAPAIDTSALTEASPTALRFDNQQRLEDGRVWSYVDVATRAISAQQLSEIGDIKLQWQPTRGDLIIHAAEILRNGRRIDLLKSDQPFTVLRRETELDQRMLDGVLTATMAAEGLAVGDVLHIAFSITSKDPTLGGFLQTYAPLPTSPAPIGFGRLRLSWPENGDVRWKSYAEGLSAKPVVVDGFNVLDVPLPVAKQPDIPSDAPMRFQHLPILEATTFRDWPAVSKVMAPLYSTEGTIAPGSPLAEEVARIMAADKDPLRRTERALRLVQDKVRYLMLGMDTGNYVPQSPAQTWTRRYGDCKAKTLLLLAMLHAMDIEAEPVAANLTLGDMVTERLPGAGAFNHVLVRAQIADRGLWLDGTGSGTRLADLADTPRLGAVLPLRAAGATLMPVTLKADARPDMIVDIDLDDRGGVDTPTLVKASIVLRGGVAEQIGTAATQASVEQRQEMVQKLLTDQVGSGNYIDPTIKYDAETGIVSIAATGITGTRWARQDGRYRLGLDAALAKLTFDPDRSRAAWQAIPVALPGPSGVVYRTTLHLPDGGVGYVLEGDRTLPPTLAGALLRRTVTATPSQVVVEDRVDQVGAEIAASAISVTRAALASSRGRELAIVAPADVRKNPDYWPSKRRDGLSRSTDAMFSRVADADPKNASIYEWRARYRLGGLDREGAVADYTRAIEIEQTVALHLARASTYALLGKEAAERADVEAALALDPDSEAALSASATYLARHGDVAKAVTLIDRRLDGAGSKDRLRWVMAKADAQAGGGLYDAAIATLDEGIDARPNQPDLLNSRCWIRGIGNVTLDKALRDCTRAIELGDNAAAALDSRAMIYYRLGRFDDALTDLSAALDASSNMPPASLFMKGVVLSRLGRTAEGTAVVKQAVLLDPQVSKTYASYGIKP